jgi:hypothetical protein
MFLLFSQAKQIPHTSYWGLFIVSVSILKGVIVKSELPDSLARLNQN